MWAKVGYLFCGWLEGIVPFVDLHERVGLEWPFRACRERRCYGVKGGVMVLVRGGVIVVVRGGVIVLVRGGVSRSNERVGLEWPFRACRERGCYGSRETRCYSTRERGCYGSRERVGLEWPFRACRERGVMAVVRRGVMVVVRGGVSRSNERVLCH